ncbi:Hypp7054 [Branchiostoma lanceolatum]|uniref:Hypp7054 protein n=1 Tax=Branchiostoma lanceolatum TaxID=7740 RepID=A0A8K0E6S8_BRALA|nr:Hypp7054 [Branchiostoma lanceolatum]
MASENKPPLAALRKKTYEHIARSRDRHPDYARALTLNLLEEQKLRSTFVLLDRQKTAEISKFRLEHRAFLSRAKSATEQLSRESLGESRGIRRPWSEFGMTSRVQFQSAEARLVHGGGSRAGQHKTTASPYENRSKLRLKGHGFYTHCHHCAKRYIRSAVKGQGRDCEHDDVMSSRSLTPERDDVQQLTDKDPRVKDSNPEFAVPGGPVVTFEQPLQNAQKPSRPTTAATGTRVITPQASKPPRPPTTEDNSRPSRRNSAYAHLHIRDSTKATPTSRRRSSTSKPRGLLNTGVSKRNPTESQFAANGTTRDNVTTTENSPTKNHDQILTGFNNRNDNSAPNGQHQNGRTVVKERVTHSLPSSPRGRWLWAFRAVVRETSCRSRQTPEITGNQDTTTSINVAKPKKGTKKKKRKGKNAKSKDRTAQNGDQTSADKDGEKSWKQKGSSGPNTKGYKPQGKMLPVSAKARWLWAMHEVLRAKNRKKIKRVSQKPIAHEKNTVVETSGAENPLPCSPKERWLWAMKAITRNKKSTKGSKKGKSRVIEHVQTASNDRPKINPIGTQQNPSTAKGRWLWAIKAVLKQTARRRYDTAGSLTRLPSCPKERWHWAMRAVLRNKDKFEKEEKPSLDDKHTKKTKEETTTTSSSKTKTAKTEIPTSRPVLHKRGRRNSHAAVSSFLGAVSYTHQTSGIFGKPGNKTRSGRHRSFKFDPRTLLRQTKEQEKQKESYEDMMEKFKKLRNCRYLRWRKGQDPYLNDTFDMPLQTSILTLPLPTPVTTRSKLARKPSFRQANRSLFSTSVVAMTAVSVPRK